MNNKKGQAGIGENIGNILQTMPKQLKIGLFLLFLLLFAVVFSYILNMFGVHCSSEDEVYTVPMYDAVRNLNLMFNRPSYAEISSEVVPSPKIFLLIDKCIHKSTNGTCYYDGGYCTECTETTISDIGGYKTETYCGSDVYRVDNKGFFKKWICEGRELGCEPPIGFYFNQTLCGYVCMSDNETCTGLNVGQIWDIKLNDLGGRKIYENDESTGRAYDDAFRLSCIELRPTFKFFGIPIFDFRIWIVLLLVSVFGMFVLKLHEMDK